MKDITIQAKVGFLGKAMLTSILIMISCAIIIGSLAYFTSWIATERILIVVNYISVFSGAFYAGRNSSEKLWLNGLILGVIYYVGLTIVFGNIATAISQWLWIKQFLIVSGIGILGGVCSGLID